MAATNAPETRQAGSCTVILPDARPPTEAQAARFDEADQALLHRLFEEPVEYVDHKLFERPDCEELLFATQHQPRHRRSRNGENGNGHTESNATLNSAQEVQLFQRFNYARLRIARLFEKYHRKAMPADALRELLRWAHEATKARGQIVQANIPLVLAMAKRTRLSGLDFNELISEGNFALLRSVDKFDCSRGFKFSTYACRAILKSFSRVALRTSRYRGRFPTEFDPSLEKSDFIDRKRDNLEADCVEELREILALNRADLNDMEQTVIRERFALEASPDCAKPKTLEQVGELIGVTKERVRQIQNKALRKIRSILEDNFLAA